VAAPPPEAPGLPRVDVELHSLRLSEREVSRLATLLSRGERERATRYRCPQDRRRFVARRGRLREVLGARLAVPPQCVGLDGGRFEKPRLAGADFSFSASHSGDLMMLAISDVEVGCDIERIDESFDWQAVSGTVCADAERTCLDLLSSAAARRQFFDWWTQKEAVVKAIGDGLAYPVRSIDLSEGRKRVAAGDQSWMVSALSPAPGYCGAVAVEQAQP
jgi:4'-phosphopantetheinyl transferase